MGAVIMVAILLFYVACFFLGLVLCIPIGPVNLEVFHLAVTKHNSQALSIAFGAAVGDGIWATAAFFGITPFMSNRYIEALFLFATAVVTFALGIASLRDANFVQRIEQKELEISRRVKRKRWAVLKGLSMVLINPLGIASWMICLAFLRKFEVYIPMRLSYEVVFFFVVVAGVMVYFSAIVFITDKMKHLFNPRSTGRVIRWLGYLLIAFSLIFLVNATKTCFFHPASGGVLLR